MNTNLKLQQLREQENEYQSQGIQQEQRLLKKEQKPIMTFTIMVKRRS